MGWRLIGQLVGVPRPWSAVVEVWGDAGGDDWRDAYFLGRDPAPADLAYWLAEVGAPAFDHLQDDWQGETPDAAAWLERIAAKTNRCVADLLATEAAF